MPTLRTPRLLLRPIVEADRAAWLEADIANGAFWAKWIPGFGPEDPPTPEARFERELVATRDGLGDASAFRFGAFDIATNAVVGWCVLNRIDRRSTLSADMGWRLVESRLHQGLALEMCSALLAFAFRALPEGEAGEGHNGGDAPGAGLHRVQAAIAPQNIRSIQLANRLSLRCEGMAKGLHRHNGVWQDCLMYAMLVDECRWK